MATNQSIDQKIALGLGWFSIGLGLAQIFAPARTARTAGLKKNNLLMRFMGIREMTCGVGILTQRKMHRWLWARVAGDAMDLAVLGTSLFSRKKERAKVAASTATVAGLSALDVYCARKMSADENAATQKISVRKSITIDRSPEDLFEFWIHFERLAVVMNHLESIERIGHNRWRWVAKAPVGMHVEWDAEVTDCRENELIAWKSLAGADVDNSGTVRFDAAPAGRGTMVHVELQYSPPAGVIGAKIAKLFGEAPEQQIGVDLKRFKQLMETGEIARTEGQSAGRSSSTSRRFDDFVRS